MLNKMRVMLFLDVTIVLTTTISGLGQGLLISD